ncbi:mandelate racemase/muconate lactonizing enzyme family protein [Paenibacillus cremeus]|uniref:Mandelate racemase/muconate lactonizing enzyme family protein n=1 Tax=Paenibacillus cremeus TaxID=2163881 RepID=A0A559K790_9BACL|nr:mandelate racemase/muconate lactonizing enzyme family protein [Paenibacillus cremeus]TVY08002.1 mandelate racemase/muconate lactonizing enzyme family protein [Paenibacillus cremeus]
MTMDADLTIKEVRIIELVDLNQQHEQRFVEIVSYGGLTGHAGPLDGHYQFSAVNSRLHVFNKHLAGRNLFDPAIEFSSLWDAVYPSNPLTAYEHGKDPLTGENLWRSHRTSRHTATGEIITAFSAVDIAIWDLRGKAERKPVSQLLGGKRAELEAYISCMGSKTPEEALEKARRWYDQGFKRHKCFLPHRPIDALGIKKNLSFLETLNKLLPGDSQVMYDLSRLSDQIDDISTRKSRLSWASKLVKEMVPFRPVWIEEPTAPDDIEGYETIKQANPSSVLAGGEHLYTRWSLKPFLDRGLLDYVQCDPEWCGGISESIAICKMIESSYPKVRIVPHGHMILAAPHIVAAQTMNLSPFVEYLYQVIPDRVRYFQRAVEPVNGTLEVPQEPGVGPILDNTKFKITRIYQDEESI